ncbi:MAG: Uncharacterised protein [Rhodospirillaceae bacterium]|nr:MAG: Uncharacterised protein [Rhodospirillaceae bacterium]
MALLSRAQTINQASRFPRFKGEAFLLYIILLSVVVIL